jgi:very-short-patch-repair endonuclease
MNTFFALAFLVLLAFFVGEVARKRKQGQSASTLPTFQQHPILSDIEQKLYRRLTAALPEAVVLAQVQVCRLVGIQNGPLWQTWFNKISRKSIDFVICRADFSIWAVIELDDSTHKGRERFDADKDSALIGAGYAMIRWQARDLPTIPAIQATFQNLPLR